MKAFKQIVILFCFLMISVLPCFSQDLMLAEVLTGNPHGTNSEVMYKWSVEVRRADSKGGLLYLDVAVIAM